MSQISIHRLVGLAAGFLTGFFVLSASAIADESDNLARDDQGAKFKGFLTLVGGKILSGTDYGGVTGAQNYPCPCYVADWANGGVYTTKFSTAPESHAGLQMDYGVDNHLSFMGQVTTRANQTFGIQYALADYKVDGHWDVHFGRERLPLYYYSDFLDLGLAYPWVSPPSPVYGWESTNYNGGSVRYKTTIGDLSLSGQVYGGFEYIHKDLYAALITFPPTYANTRWRNIVGVSLEANDDWLTVHANYLNTDVTWDDTVTKQNLDTQKLNVYGLAANADFENWFVISEGGAFIRNNYLAGFTEHEAFWTAGVGVRFGKWTPVINYARFLDRYTYQNPAISGIPGFPNGSFGTTLRYDIDSSSAIKVQYDKFEDLSDLNAVGNSKLLRFSFDKVF